ncbi:MAG: COG1361 S-layer family protein [Candidatus Woesearchaeota archaeon]
MLISSAFAIQNTDRALIVPTLVNQQPDPVQPGNYVELRFRIDNLGQQAKEYEFELLAEFPFSFDNPSDAQRTVRIGGGESGSSARVIHYRVRVDAQAAEGLQNSVRLKYHEAGRPQSHIISEFPIRIETQRGLVQVNSVQVEPENPQVGSQFTLRIGVENLGNNFIQNVQVNMNTDESGIRPIGSSNKRIISQIHGQETRMLDFTYFIDAQADVGVHQIPVSISYVDSRGEERELETKIGVPINAEPSYVINIQNTDIVVSGTRGRVTVSVSNTGQSSLNFAYLTLQETEDYVILNSPNSYLGNLLSDDFETAQFEIYAHNTDAESIDLQFALSYRDSFYTQFTDEFSLPLRLFDRETAQNVGLLPTQGRGGLIFFGLLIIGIVAFVWYRKKKKSKDDEEE